MVAGRWASGGTRVLALWAVAAAGACGSGSQRGSDAAAASPWSIKDLPATHNALAVHGVGSDLYVAGESGMVLRTGDGARTWVDVSVPPGSVRATLSTYPVFEFIAASAADDVWLAGAAQPESGVLMHTTDAGQSWQASDVGAVGPFFGVWSVDRAHVVAVTGKGQILVTGDGGTSWAMTFSDPTMWLWGVWGSGNGELYAVGGVSLTSADGGAGGTGGGALVDGGAVTAAGYRGVMLHSTDGGTTWQNVADAGTACILWRVSGTVDGATVNAVGNCGSAASTTDHGSTWSRSGAVSADRDYAVNDVWVSPTGTSYLLEGGRGFSGPATPQNQFVCRAVEVADNGGALVVVSSGCELLPLKNGGISSPIAIWGTTDEDVWVLGGDGLLWHRP